MNKLLRAGFIRMLKSKVFLAIAALSACGAAFIRLYLYSGAPEGRVIPLDTGFFTITGFLGILMAAFCSLFVGTEYSDGTIRNKLAVGHSRTMVYISNLILCASAGIMFLLIFWITSIAVNAPLSGFFIGTAESILLPAALSCALALAFSAIFILISVIIQNKAVASVIALILSFTMIFIATYIMAGLDEPEFIDLYSYQIDGVSESTLTPNSAYLRGAKRDIYEFLFDFLPSAQGLRFGHMDMQKPNEPISAVYSLLIALISTFAGAVIFKYRNIR